MSWAFNLLQSISPIDFLTSEALPGLSLDVVLCPIAFVSKEASAIHTYPWTCMPFLVPLLLVHHLNGQSLTWWLWSCCRSLVPFQKCNLKWQSDKQNIFCIWSFYRCCIFMVILCYAKAWLKTSIFISVSIEMEIYMTLVTYNAVGPSYLE